MNENYTETNDFLVSVIGSAPFGIVAVNMEGEVSICNKLALTHLEIKGKTTKIIESDILEVTNKIPRLNRKLSQCLKKGRTAFDLNNILVTDRVLNIKGRPILNGMIITTQDTTEAKEVERKILGAMLEGQENERRRLAKEIHDGIGPLMSTIKMNIESFKKDMDAASEKTIQKMENVEGLIQDVANDIRGISHALVPSALKDFGLITTLENLVLKGNQAEQMNIELFSSGMDIRLEPKVELGLYRITQELLNNALKYSQANNITIQIIKHPTNIILTVEDDGLGFEKERIDEFVNAGIGLRNIKSRIMALGGTFTIDTSPGNGVMATIELPIKESKNRLNLKR